MKLSARIAGLSGLAVATVALGACSGGGSGQPSTPPPAPATSPVVSTPSATVSSTPPARPAPVNPLTGGKVSHNPVVAVKIDDTGNGRPQIGITKADIVYIEQVEGGLSRLLAVYNSALPTRVEPVRSTRAGDPELLGEYGPIAYVTSGGSHNPLAVLDRSDLHSDINDRGGPGFRRDPNRPAPYNLEANLDEIAKQIKSVKARDIGLTWSKTIPNTRTRTGTKVRTEVGSTRIRFDWNAKRQRYIRRINGAIQRTAGGVIISTPNVIVQFCKVNVYTKDRDVLGNPNYYTHTIGKGKVVVFRNGRSVTGTWSRPTLHSPTKLVDAGGRRIPLSPGGAWFVLVARNAPLSR